MNPPCKRRPDQEKILVCYDVLDKVLGIFTIITAFVQTDKGSIEILYDEGYRGKTALDDAVKFLTENLGLSGLILRCIISLKNRL